MVIKRKRDDSVVKMNSKKKIWSTGTAAGIEIRLEGLGDCAWLQKRLDGGSSFDSAFLRVNGVLARSVYRPWETHSAVFVHISCPFRKVLFSDWRNSTCLYMELDNGTHAKSSAHADYL